MYNFLLLFFFQNSGYHGCYFTSEQENTRQQMALCGVCVKECRSNVIQCSTCNSWFHCRCEQLTYEQLVSLGWDRTPVAIHSTSTSISKLDLKLSAHHTRKPAKVVHVLVDIRLHRQSNQQHLLLVHQSYLYIRQSMEWQICVCES